METVRILPKELGRALDVPAGALQPTPGLQPGQAAGAAQAPVTVPFKELLTQAVQSANDLGQKSDALNTALVQGRPVDLHRVMLAQQESQIAFDLVLQMRDKLVSAYQEILRMPM